MRQWRIGTMSLGLTLLLLGVGLVYAQIEQSRAASLLLDWWPLIFVVLGLEILAQYVINRKGEFQMKYDLSQYVSDIHSRSQRPCPATGRGKRSAIDDQG